MKSIGDKEKRRLRAIAIIKSSIIEAYDDTEKEATLFATGLVQKLMDEDILWGEIMSIFWELLRYVENKEGRFYKIIDTAETDEMNPHIPKFADEQHGDIILGHHNDGDGRLEAYLIK